MKHISRAFLIIVCLAVLCSCVQSNTHDDIAIDKDYTVFVNPLIGTTGDNETEYGGTIPAVLEPYGMTHWTAMTRENKIGACAYHFDDTAIVGFIGTHQPAVWMGDYGQVSLMPQTVLEPNFKKRGISFSHINEKSTSYLYQVDLDNDIKIKMAATARCGIFEVEYPEKENKYIVIDASREQTSEGFIKIVPEENQIIGYNPDRQSAYLSQLQLPGFKGYFVIQFQDQWEEAGVYHHDSILLPQKSEFKGTKLGAYIKFPNSGKQLFSFSVGTSFISLEQAHENLQKEISRQSLSLIATQTKNLWNEQLGRIHAESSDTDKLTVFYTALYRTAMLPRTFSEYGRYYSAFDDKVHRGESYTDFSLWDTYRALHPLLIFTAPERVDAMMQALVQNYQEGGWLPKWPNPSYTNIMIGTHADAVIADAYVKGFRGIDAEKAYEGMYKNAMTSPDNDSICKWQDRLPDAPYEARGGLHWYKKLGYVPCDKVEESVSRTIEFAFDDYCVAQMAKALGKNEDYSFFIQRSNNYKHLYNEKRGLFAAKKTDGNWSEDTAIVYLPRWKAYKANGFTEGSPYTYLFGAMHDIKGLIELLGGKTEFRKKLNENFEKQYYRHDNEPGHHYIYLYNYLNDYQKTQKLISEHLTKNYQNTPAGLSGNEDCGQMSAWLVMSSLGFYSLPPASGKYALGVPQFDKILLRKPNGGELTILNKSKNKLIKTIKLDDESLTTYFVSHEQLLSADSLVFE